MSYSLLVRARGDAREILPRDLPTVPQTFLKLSINERLHTLKLDYFPLKITTHLLASQKSLLAFQYVPMCVYNSLKEKTFTY